MAVVAERIQVKVMANTDLSQAALGESPIFRSRVKTALLKVAQGVNPPTAFGDLVLANPGVYASQISPFLSIRTSIIAFETVPSWAGGPSAYADTLAGDADIEAQILFDWAELTRVFGG